MVPWRATEEGFVTQDNLDWYRRFAEGRPAAIVVEATGVRDIASGPLLRIGDDRFLPGLKNLSKRFVKQAMVTRNFSFKSSISSRSNAGLIRAKYFERFLKITPRHREIIAELIGRSAISER